MADQRILYSEEMVGASHATKSDTLNRHGLVEHNNDGTHEKLTVGSDADGDIYYRTSGVLARLGKGSIGNILTMNAGATAPEWKDVINLVGGQIAFPATAVPSADANTMDDYEEGSTGTITATCGTSGTIGIAGTLDTLSYTKIGRVVHMQGQLYFTNPSSPVGILTLNGILPFTISTSLPDGGEIVSIDIVHLSLVGACTLGLEAHCSGTSIVVYNKTTTTADGTAVAQMFGEASRLTFNFSYITDL